MRIAIIGTYPPPYGGISIHVKRLKKYLEKNNVKVSIYSEANCVKDISNGIFNIKSYRKFIFMVPFIKADIIHFHSISIRVRILLGFYKLLNKKIILTIHGDSAYNQLKNSSCLIRFLLIKSFNKIDKIVCVNNDIIKDLSEYKIDKRKLILIPAYSSPFEEKRDFEKISGDVWEFINNSKFLICANGWIRFNNNVDLYGIDMLIELIRRIKLCGKDVKLLIALLGAEAQNKNEKIYYEDLKNKINEYELQKDILVHEVKDTEFYPILKRSQLFIRPTNTDGDAVSLREALYYHVPAIASDVVSRPCGTMVFNNRNMNELFNLTISLIDNYQKYKDKLNGIKVYDNAERLLNVYNELLRK